MGSKSTLLLGHYLKELRLPSFLREYGKMASQCAAEIADHPEHLLRLAELELRDAGRLKSLALKELAQLSCRGANSRVGQPVRSCAHNVENPHDAGSAPCFEFLSTPSTLLDRAWWWSGLRCPQSWGNSNFEEAYYELHKPGQTRRPSQPGRCI